MLGWLTETTVIALGLAAVAIVASHVRSVGPTTRHALWLVVMIKLVTPPLLSWPWAISLPISNWFVSSTLKELEPHDVPVITTVWADQSKSGVKPMVVPSTLNPANDPTHRVFGDLMSEPSRMWLAWSEAPPAVLQRGWVKYRGLPKRSQLAWSAGSAWLLGSLFLAVGQAIRIVRFRRRLCAAVPAPDQLVSELERIGDRLDTRAPEILVLAELSTPMLWCWGRSRLLLPARLVKSLPLDRWRGVLTHELAHLRRGDQWVSRLELVAGLIWWWNPIYWLARARISAEAELACDAWVVWALPKDRVAYAEVLFDVCALLSLSPSRPAAPALGIAGSGRFFERRLTLILHNHVPRRLSPLGLFAACLLLLFAVPSWSKSEPASARQDILSTYSARATTCDLSIADDDTTNADATDDTNDGKKVVRKDEDDDDKDADDDDDDDDDRDKDDDTPSRLEQKAKAKARKSDQNVDVDLAKLKKELESKFGADSDFEKKIEELGGKIGKEMEAKFGPGSEFEKKMEAFGKEMEAKFGEGSEFAKKMEAFGKEMEAKFGVGSDFEKRVKDLAEDMKKKYGPGSEFAKNLKDKTDVDIMAKKKSNELESSVRAQGELNRTEVAKHKATVRERRIQKLEAQIRELVDEIKALKAEASEK